MTEPLLSARLMLGGEWADPAPALRELRVKDPGRLRAGRAGGTNRSLGSKEQCARDERILSI